MEDVDVGLLLFLIFWNEIREANNEEPIFTEDTKRRLNELLDGSRINEDSW